MSRLVQAARLYENKRRALASFLVFFVLLEAAMEFFFQRISPPAATFMTFLLLYAGSFVLLKKRRGADFLLFLAGLYLFLFHSVILGVSLLFLGFRPFWPLFRRPLKGFFVALGVGSLLGVHLLYSALSSGAFTGHFPTLHALLFSFLIHAPLEEIFYRRFFFGTLRHLGTSLTHATLFVEFAVIFRYLLNPIFTSSLVTLSAALLYLSILHFSLSLLYERSHSLAATAVANGVFSASVRFLTLPL